MDVRRLEIMPERIHRQQRREPGHIPEIVLERAAREFRAARRLDGHDADIPAFDKVPAQEREAQSCEIAAAAEAADHHVRLGAGHLHLCDRLLPDDGLVQDHVVQHAAQAVAGVLRVLQSHLHGLRDRQPEASRAVGVAFERCAARGGDCAGRRDALGAPRVHHQPPVGFLFVADLHHENLHVEPEMLGCEGDGRAPLPGARFGRQVAYALLVVVVGLRHGGVGLVRSGGRYAFVLEIDLCRGAEGFFQSRGAHQRRRPPYLVDLLHLFGDVDETLRRHLLVDQFFGEDGAHLLLRHGLLGRGMQRRQRFVGHVGHDVVPLCGHLTLGQAEFLCFHVFFCLFLCSVKCDAKEKARCLLSRKQRACVFVMLSTIHALSRTHCPRESTSATTMPVC